MERKERARKAVPEETVQNAASLVARFPHLGSRKGQAYMLYHQLGYVGMDLWDRIKKDVKRLLMQELARRHLFPGRKFYEHVRPQGLGEIWAEDFTELAVEGATFKVALLLDVFDEYYLGAAVARRATAALVGRPVEQALEASGGKGPDRFLLSDNGSPYISDDEKPILVPDGKACCRRI